MRIKGKGRHAKTLKLSMLAMILILLLILSVMFAATYAIFTSSRSAQRTIAAYDTEGERFSSNYLIKSASKDNVRTVYTTDVNVSTVAVVTVCNYQQGRETLPYPSPISYTVTARLVRYDESSPQEYVEATGEYLTANSLTDYSITVSNGTVTKTLNSLNVSDTFSASMPGDTAKLDAYTVTYSRNFGANKPNLYLELIAEPDTAMLSTLRGIFKPDFRVAGAADYWSGTFRDDSSYAPSAYDGYNYLITGTGAGSVTITWDGLKVTLSDISKEALLSIEGARQTGESITFPVDSDTASRYDLQFYKKNITTETWQQMTSEVVTFSFS